VCAFEPQPALAQYLKEIAARQGWDNVSVEAAGLSASSGSMELFVPAAEGAPSPGATLSPVDRNELHHRVQVRVVTLDEYIEKLGSPRVAFIKCDVEGHERAVFEGARRLLARDHPVLLFECEQRHLPGSSPAAIFDDLRALGYRGYLLHTSGLLPVEQFSVERHQPVRPGRYWDTKDYFNNFVFLAESDS
jgi:FkbM family methyltransferase